MQRIDVFIDQGIDIRLLARLQALSLDRKAAVHATDLETGRNEIFIARDPNEQSRLDGHIFWRIVMPTTRVHLVGAGPAVPAIAHLLAAIGFSTEIVCPDDATREEARSFGLNCKALTNGAIEALKGDRWSAAILAFHEHEWELPLLESSFIQTAFTLAFWEARPSLNAASSNFRGAALTVAGSHGFARR